MEHPFKVGTRVAVVSGYDECNFVEATVLKVYKTGHFTISGRTGDRPEQWAARQYTGHPWYAERTADRGSYSRHHTTVRLLDEVFLAEQAKEQARRDLRRRAHEALSAVRSVSADWLTEWQVEALEYFVALQKGAE